MSFSQKDGVLTFTATEGHRRGQTITFRAREKEDFDPGYKTSYLKGAGYIVGIAEGTSEPKFTIDASDASAVENVRDAAHDPTTGAALRGTLTHVFRRTGVGSLAYRYEEVKWSEGGGYSSGDDGVKSKMGFMMQRAFVSLNGARHKRIV